MAEVILIIVMLRHHCSCIAYLVKFFYSVLSTMFVTNKAVYNFVQVCLIQVTSAACDVCGRDGFLID